MNSYFRRCTKFLPSLAVGVMFPEDTKKLSFQMENFVSDIQSKMISGLESVDPSAKFTLDPWKKPNKQGYGITAVLQDSKIFEKAGVNYSVLRQKAPKRMLLQMADKLQVDLDEDYEMFVAGVSMVIHPKNPNAPTFHANYRYFELSSPNLPPISWFGGGCDLTPSYLYPSDAKTFHTLLKQTCDDHDISFYPAFKPWCDRYFLNTHRSESRGIGGIFFDDLIATPSVFEFVKDCGNLLVDLYIPILQKRVNMDYSEEMKRWQQIRRGRYVEFNLIHDRGTKFGLVTPGVRIESVLMSLPLTARWEYCHEPEPGSRESQLVEVLKNPVDWVDAEVEDE